MTNTYRLQMKALFKKECWKCKQPYLAAKSWDSSMCPSCFSAGIAYVEKVTYRVNKDRFYVIKNIHGYKILNKQQFMKLSNRRREQTYLACGSLDHCEKYIQKYEKMD